MGDIRIFIQVFEENENIYPVKPELLASNSRKSMVYFFLFILLFSMISTSYITNTYIVLAEVLLVAVVHELGHYAMMKFFNSQAQGMFFMSFLGGRIKSLKFSNSLKEQTFINLMGPLPGIVVGVILFLLVLNSESNVYVIELALLFLGINLINLLPIDPFDGGRILGGFYFNSNDRLKMMFTLFSSVTLIVVGVFLSFIPLIVFGFLMGLKVRGLQKSNELHENLAEVDVNYKKTYEDLSNREYWKIRTVFLRKNPKLKEMIPSGYTLWENERLLVEQVRQILRVDTKSDMSILGKIAVMIIMLLFIVYPIYLVFSNLEVIDWYLDNTDV